jgi:hypothetical protein
MREASGLFRATSQPVARHFIPTLSHFSTFANPDIAYGEMTQSIVCVEARPRLDAPGRD